MIFFVRIFLDISNISLFKEADISTDYDILLTFLPIITFFKPQIIYSHGQGLLVFPVNVRIFSLVFYKITLM